jgi:hypothetical protein
LVKLSITTSSIEELTVTVEVLEKPAEALASVKGLVKSTLSYSNAIIVASETVPL